MGKPTAKPRENAKNETNQEPGGERRSDEPFGSELFSPQMKKFSTGPCPKSGKERR